MNQIMTRIKNLLRYRTGWVLLSIGVYGIIWWLFSWFITGEVLYMFSTLKARAVFSGCIVLPLVVSAFMIDDYYHDYI